VKKQEDFYLPKIRYDVVKQMGFIKHAFVLTFYFLLVHAKEGRKLTHFDAIKEVISLAGDSDTNACIVGGMMGGLLGYKALDKQMVKITLSCDVTGEGQHRPEWLSVGQTAIPNIKKLIECRVVDTYKFVNHPDQK